MDGYVRSLLPVQIPRDPRIVVLKRCITCKNSLQIQNDLQVQYILGRSVAAACIKALCILQLVSGDGLLL